MATDPHLLERIYRLLASKRIAFREIKMFGGHCFMVDEKMCFGTYQNGLMVRVGPEVAVNQGDRDFVHQMTHGGREMKGYLLIDPEGYDQESELDFWLQKSLDYNPTARASKKKR